METAAGWARRGNRILNFLVMSLILLMFLYGGYSLWDTAMVYRGAFVSVDLLKFKPAADEPDNPTLGELAAINEDVLGWVTVDDTHIDYPVVQGETNMEYINKDVYGEFSLSGSVFLDSANSPDFSDPYSLLYGHHMDNGGMFGDIVKFVEEGYFQGHPEGTLYLPGRTYRMELFACVEADAYDSMVFQPTAQEGDAGELLSWIRENAVQYREIGVSGEEKIIGLSTCAGAETNGRVIVYGRLEEAGQAQEGGA